MEWFQRVADQTNLRLPGSEPFRLSVKFHAYPGLELLPPGKGQILTGEGNYEETWLDAHEWRREVTLGPYHAVETEGNHVRKMQASSAYIPSRVVMLMTALLYRISSYNLTPYLESQHRWKIQHISDGTHDLVKIFTPEVDSDLLHSSTVYLFTPSGVLVQSNEWDIVTTWEDDFIFGGKIAPRHIQIQADAQRDLVTADLAIEPLPTPVPAAFDLPVARADPGFTLRPLGADLTQPDFHQDWANLDLAGVPPDLMIRVNFDRTGASRDVEIISVGTDSGRSLQSAGVLLASIRATEHSPPRIDSYPCQTALNELHALKHLWMPSIR